MKNPQILTQALVALLILLALYDRFYPATPAAPSGPVQPAVPTRLEAAAVEYRNNLPGTFSALARGIRQGDLKTKTDGVAALSGSRNPLVNALNATFDAHCDKDGNIADPAGLAADLDRAAKALGAK